MFQLTTGALAFDPEANAFQLDAFGNPLCLNGIDHSGSGQGDSGHSKQPGCCLAGCCLSSAALMPPPDAPSLPLKVVASSQVVVAIRPAIVFRDRGYVPGNPRAPPLMG
jgi:hypothetical protein